MKLKLYVVNQIIKKLVLQNIQVSIAKINLVNSLYNMKIINYIVLTLNVT